MPLTPKQRQIIDRYISHPAPIPGPLKKQAAGAWLKLSREIQKELRKDIEEAGDRDLRQVMGNIKSTLLSHFPHLEIFVNQHGNYITINDRKISPPGNLDYEEMREEFNLSIMKILYELEPVFTQRYDNEPPGYVPSVLTRR